MKGGCKCCITLGWNFSPEAATFDTVMCCCFQQTPHHTTTNNNNNGKRIEKSKWRHREWTKGKLDLRLGYAACWSLVVVPTEDGLQTSGTHLNNTWLPTHIQKTTTTAMDCVMSHTCSNMGLRKECAFFFFLSSCSLHSSNILGVAIRSRGGTNLIHYQYLVQEWWDLFIRYWWLPIHILFCNKCRWTVIAPYDSLRWSAWVS